MLDPNRSKRAHLFHPENQVFGVTRGRSGTQEPHIKGVPPRVVLSEWSSHMKKLMLICFALALVMSLLALAQEATKPDEMKQDTMKAEKASAKAVSLTGNISADGKTFVDKDNKSWTVSNPEALKGHEGHAVTLKVHEDAAKNEIHVVSVKMAKGEMKESTKKDEMKK